MTRAWLKKVDHLTYAVKDIKKWAYLFIEIMGGMLVLKIDDVDPESVHSSMMLWCIDFGDFGIALVSPIDRHDESQVSAFIRAHGEGMIQHPAFEVRNHSAFLKHLASYGVHMRGETLEKDDGFGWVRQVFSKGCTENRDPGEMAFMEFVQRNFKNARRRANKKSGSARTQKSKKRATTPRKRKTKITFSRKAGKGFYEQLENARNKHDIETIFDNFTASKEWEPKVMKRGRKNG